MQIEDFAAPSPENYFDAYETGYRKIRIVYTHLKNNNIPFNGHTYRQKRIFYQKPAIADNQPPDPFGSHWKFSRWSLEKVTCGSSCLFYDVTRPHVSKRLRIKHTR